MINSVRPGKRKTMNANEQSLEKTKASIRAKCGASIENYQTSVWLRPGEVSGLGGKRQPISCTLGIHELVNLQKNVARVGQMHLDFAKWQNPDKKQAII